MAVFDEYLRLPRTVHLLCLGTFVSRLGSMFIPFLTLYLKARLGYSDQFATLALGCLGLGSVCGALIGGHLADQLGRRPVMIAALLGAAVMILAYSQFRSPAALLIGVGVYALVNDMFRPAASAMIADLVEPHRRPYAFGLQYMSLNLGFGIGPLLGGLLVALSFDLIFLANALALWVFSVMLLGSVPESAAPADHAAQRGAGPAGPGEPAPRAEPRYGLAASLAHIRRDTTFLMFLTATFFVSVVYTQSLSTFPLYLNALHISPASYGWIIALNGLMIAAGQIAVTNFVTRYDRGWMLALSAALTALGFGLKALAQVEWHFAATVCIWTLGEMVQASLLAPFVAEIAPAALRARYMGMVSMAYSSAGALGAPLGGLILASAGGQALWAGAFVIALGGATLYAAIRIQLRKVEPSPTPATGERA